MESWASWSCFLSYSCLATSRASRINAAFFLTSSRAHRVRVSWNSSIFSSIQGVEKEAWRHEVMMWKSVGVVGQICNITDEHTYHNSLRVEIIIAFSQQFIKRKSYWRTLHNKTWHHSAMQDTSLQYISLHCTDHYDSIHIWIINQSNILPDWYSSKAAVTYSLPACAMSVSTDASGIVIMSMLSIAPIIYSK